MAIAYIKLFQPSALTAVAAQLAAVPATPLSNVLINGRMRATNNSVTAASVTIYAVPSTGSVGATNLLVNAKSIAPNDYFDTDLPELVAGDSIWALGGTAGAITVHFMDGVIRS